MGLPTLSFPWLFGGPAPVLALAGLALAWFEAVRRLPALAPRFGSVLSAVERPGRGEIYYVLGVATTFLVADGNILGFFAVALACAFAGLVVAGQRPALLPALLLAGLTTALEAFAWRGADNLLVPLGAALLLRWMELPS